MYLRSLRLHFIRLSSIACAIVVALTLPSAAVQESADTSATSELEALFNVEVSSAMKYGRKTAEIPASVTIITADQIERYGFRTPLEAIGTLSGVYLSYDRNYSYIGVRGFGRPTDYNNRITILVNGHVMNENYYHSGYLGTELPVSIDAVERIEIVRGPGSVLYGTGAMFAVVNIVTKDLSSLDGAILRMGAGQFGEISASGILSRALSAGTDLIVSGTWEDSDGRTLYFPAYDNLISNYGVSETEDWERSQGIIGVLTHGKLRIQGMYTNRWKGIPTGAWGTNFNSDNSKTLDRFAHGEIAYDARVHTTAVLSSRVYYDHYNYVGYFPYDETMNMDANWSHSLGSELRLTWDPRANNRVVVGLTREENIQARYKYWDVPAPIYYDEDRPYFTMSGYVQDEYQILPNVAIILGLRHDHSSLAPASTTPRAGLVYHPTLTTTIKGLYGQAFRTPTVHELYWDNSNIGYIGNPNLKPEQIQTTEVIVEQRLGRYLQLNLSAFKYRVHDLIEFVADPVDSIEVYENAGSVRTAGIEIGASARLPHETSAFANYSLQAAHDADGDDLSNSPHHVATLGTALPLRTGLTFSAVAHAESGRRTVYNTKTASFLTVDLGMSLTPDLFRRQDSRTINGRTSLHLRVTNAFDADYSTPGGYEHRSDAIPQDGRSIRATLKVQL